MGIAINTTWKARVVMFSAWKAKMATSVRSRAMIVTGWSADRKRAENHSAPFRRINTWRLIDPAASGITTKISTE
jgi:hypothetical protein